MRKQFRFSHRELYFIGLCLIAASLPLSKAGISLGQILLALSWLWSGKIFSRLKAFFGNRMALAISSVFLMHVLGLLYTSDFDYALKDLRTKLPLLILPLIISTSEQLENKKFRIVMFVGILAASVSTLFSVYNYLTFQFVDIRDICMFVSHIRLSLLVCFSVFVLLFYILQKNDFKLFLKVLFGILVLWFIVFLVILESFTGLSILTFCAFVFFLKNIFSKNNIKTKGVFLMLIVCIPAGLAYYLNSLNNKYFKVVPDSREELELFTVNGNKYYHDTLSNDMENGHYVWINICDKELRREWNKRSRIDFADKDLKGQDLKSTLIRFLASKGLRKDSAGMSMLTQKEVNSIEKGIADVNLVGMFSLEARIYETLWEFQNYRETKDPNGHSLLLRLEYWKTSLRIIEKNLFFGVGTGDMNVAFREQYEEMKSNLDKQWRLRSHNQYLSIAVGFGIVGLLWFIAVLFYPFMYKKFRQDFFVQTFFMIACFSMLTEDTIESQVGLTFFVFYSTFLLLARKMEDKKYINENP